MKRLASVLLFLGIAVLVFGSVVYGKGSKAEG